MVAEQNDAMKRPVSPKRIVSFLDRYFPEAKMPGNKADGIIVGQRRGNLVTLLEFLGGLPDELLTVDEDDYQLMKVAINYVRAVLDEASTGGDRQLKHIPQSGKKNALVEIRRILQNCSEQFIAPEIAGLEFVKDSSYRKILQEDLAEFESYLKYRQWKAATVLGAALLEAILHYKLTGMKSDVLASKLAPKHKGKVIEDLNDRAWSLTPFLKVAKDRGVIDDNPTYKIGILAGEARNLIHPGKVQRLNRRFDSASAFLVKAALEHTFRDLTERDKT